MVRTLAPKYETFEEVILCALAEATGQHGGGLYNLRNLARSKNLFFEPEWIALAEIALCHKGDVINTRASENGARYVAITETGRQRVFDILAIFPQSLRQHEEIFAPMPSDTFRGKLLTYRQFKDLLLLAACERAENGVDEVFQTIDSGNHPYNFRKIANIDGLRHSQEWLDRAVGEFYYSDLINPVETDDNKDALALINGGAFAVAEALRPKYYIGNVNTEHWDDDVSEKRFSARTIELVRGKLGEAMAAITVGNFTQEEKSQIRGLLRICDQILELPTPKLALFKRVLGMLREIKEISAIIEWIWKLLS